MKKDIFQSPKILLNILTRAGTNKESHEMYSSFIIPSNPLAFSFLRHLILFLISSAWIILGIIKFFIEYVIAFTVTGYVFVIIVWFHLKI